MGAAVGRCRRKATVYLTERRSRSIPHVPREVCLTPRQARDRVTLLRYARSPYGKTSASPDGTSSKRSGLSRAQRKKRPSRSAVKRNSHRSGGRIDYAPSRFNDPYHTTIIDPPRRSRLPYAVMAAMLLGGAAGLGFGFLRAGAGEGAELMSASSAPIADPAGLEVLPSLDEPPDAAPASEAESVAVAAVVPAAPSAPAVVPAPAAVAALVDEPTLEIVTDRLRERESLSLALTRHDVGMEEINALVAALRGKVDLRGLRAGDVFRLESEVVPAATIASATTEVDAAVVEGAKAAAPREPSLALTAFEYRPLHTQGAPVRWRVEKEGEEWRVEKQVTPITSKVVALGGEVQSSLYVAMRAIGEGAALVSRFVDVFAWDIDFYRQPKKGDTFKVIVEKQFAEGRFIGYGRVLAAEYVNAGEVHRGFAFTSKDEKVAGYFDENGRAREKTFLKNPLEIALVTSRYGQRFHPILRRQRVHHGVDYGASTGTPFWAVADGVIQEARYSPTAGNMIVVRHINGYTTEYFHASRFAEGIRPGVKVKQRQVIGYVGNTGRSTGPHLHFGMKRNGAYVDPGKQVFPAANPVPELYLPEFKQLIGPLLAELEALENV